MRWRLYIKEYSPNLCDVKSENNTVADALSRLEIASEPMEEVFFSEELRARPLLLWSRNLLHSRLPFELWPHKPSSIVRRQKRALNISP